MLELNLQLFAADNIAISNDRYANYFNAGTIDTTDAVNTTNAGAAYTGTSGTVLANLTAEMKEFYSQYLIKDVGPNLVHGQFLESEALPKNHGRTIEWRKWTDFSKKTKALTEGVTPEPSKISANPIRATLNQYGDWTLLTDLVQLQTIDNTLVEITEKHSQNAKLTLDTITRNALIAGTDATNMVCAGGVKVTEEVTGYITPNDVAKLTAYLRQNNAPTFDGSYVMIVHPYIAHDLMTNSDWIDVVKYSDNTKVYNAEIGKLYGIRFVQSTEAKVDKAISIASGTGATDDGYTITLGSSPYASNTITVPTNTFTADDITALTADDAPDLYLSHTSGGTTSVGKLKLASSSPFGTANKIVLDSTTPCVDVESGAAITPSQGDVIFAGGAARDGKDLFTCIVLGKGAGRKVDFNGSNAEIIVKPVGSAGATDPLNQRGSVGWKVDGYTAAVTNSAYIFKYYCCSKLTGAKAND